MILCTEISTQSHSLSLEGYEEQKIFLIKFPVYRRRCGVKISFGPNNLQMKIIFIAWTPYFTIYLPQHKQKQNLSCSNGLMDSLFGSGKQEQGFQFQKSNHLHIVNSFCILGQLRRSSTEIA
jgi:hypothetical protein